MSENQTPPAAAPEVPPASAFPPGVDPVAYAAQMAAKAGATSEPVLATLEDRADANRPANVPVKFWDAANQRVNTDALLQSYVELEKMRGAPAAPTEPAPAAPDAPEAPADPLKIEAPAAPEAPTAETPAPAPLAATIESLASKYEAGTVAEDDFAAAEAAGLPRNVIETYFAGLQALEASATLAAHDAAGGKDAFEAARAWAASGLNAAELDYYNSAVGDPKSTRQAVEWLASKHRAAHPAEGSFLTESAPAVNAGDVYTSQAQVTAAMRSKEYQTDPAFRADVAAKLARSRTQGSLNMSASFHSRTR